MAIFDEKIEIRERWIPKRCKGAHCVDLGESFPTSIYSLLAKFGFDTAENEPCKVRNWLLLHVPKKEIVAEFSHYKDEERESSRGERQLKGERWTGRQTEI